MSQSNLTDMDNSQALMSWFILLGTWVTQKTKETGIELKDDLKSRLFIGFWLSNLYFNVFPNFPPENVSVNTQILWEEPD